MKKKFILIVASVLIIATLGVMFTACAKTDYIGVSAIASSVQTKGTGEAVTSAIPVDEDSILYDYSYDSDLAVFRKNITTDAGEKYVYTVFSVSKNAIVYTGEDQPSDIRTYTGEMFWPDVYYTRHTETDGSQSLTFYSTSGVIAEGIPDEGIFYSQGYLASGVYSDDYGLDLGNGKAIVKQGNSYVVRDKVASAVAPLIEDDTAELENYRIYFYSGMEDFAVLDKDLNLIRNVAVSSITGSRGSEMQNVVPVVLPDDKILFQQTIILPSNTTKDYDYYYNDYYCKVRTFVYDVDKDKTKEIKDCNYVFNSVGNYLREAGVTLCSVSEISDEKLLCDSYLQGFDGDLNVALDIQAKLPGATSVSVTGDYVKISSASRVQYYKGDTLLMDVPRGKMTASESYLAVSDLLVSADGETLYNPDGTVITSLDALGATAFVQLGYAKNYIWYTAESEDPVSGVTVRYICRYDRKTGEKFRVGVEGECKFLEGGCLLARDAENDGKYELYDLYGYKKLAEGISAANVDVYSLLDGNIVATVAEKEDGTSKVVYYCVTRK